MGLLTRYWREPAKQSRAGLVRLHGSVVIGSSGAVASSDTPDFTVTLVATKTGRYRIQLVEADGSTAATPAQPTDAAGTAVTPWGIMDVNVSVISAVADNALTTSSALKWAIRNFTPLSGYFDVQFYRDVTSSTDETHTDTNIESGGQFLISFTVKLSSVTP